MIRRALPSLALAAVTAAACTSTKARGELMLVVDTDMSPGIDFDRLAIDLKVNGQTVHSEVYNELGLPGLRQFPLTYAVIGNDDPKTQVQLRVSTGRSSGGTATPVGAPTTLNELVTTVPTDRIAIVRMAVQWLCVGSARVQGDYVEGNCPEGTTCTAGTCVPWSVDPTALATFDERRVFGNGSAAGDGSCFDTIGCFSQGFAATLDRATCTIEAPVGGAGVNVAIIARRGEGGICGPDACLVPLTAESAVGWRSASGGRIQLPAAVCSPAFDHRATGIAVTTACAPRTEELPTCGPWSVVQRPGTFDGGAPRGVIGDANVTEAGDE